MKSGPPVPPHPVRERVVRHAFTSTCRHCGASITYRSTSGRCLQGMADWWRTKHEALCRHRTPVQRHTWALDFMHHTTITLNFDHPGMKLP